VALTDKETQLWKELPDPLLKAVACLVTVDAPEWSGNATELIDGLDGMNIQPNVLTRKLNIGADRLWNEYHIRYESNRTHAGRNIKLILDISEA